MKIIQHELQQHFHDVPIHFLPDANSKDFMDKKLNDEFADNCIYVVENLNFLPEEFGYVEPDPKPDDNASQADKEDVLSKGVLSQKPGEDGEQDEEQQVEEVVEVPPFTNESIHNFKKRLGIMGEIYVNDAPLASLSNSTTVNDIKCQKRVMGVQMSEDLRNIA